MALWGRDDNLASAGTVSLAWDATAKNNAGAWVVTNSGSNFASGDVGKILRFGIRGAGGTYYGDAAVDTFISATKVTIASTSGLSNVSISSTDYYKSELPQPSTQDHGWSNKHDTVAAYKQFADSETTAVTAIGSTNLSFKYHLVIPKLEVGTIGKDAINEGGSNKVIAGLGTGTVTAQLTSGVGSDRIYVNTADLPGIGAGGSTEVVASVGGASGKQPINAVASNYVGLGGTISTAVTAGDTLVFHSPHLVSIAGTVSATLAAGTELNIQRIMGGYDKQVYGISTTTSQTYDGDAGKYRTSGAGWVGVTTYIDCHGKLRVKSETLVAIGGATGITTGANGILYPTTVA